MSTRKRKTVDIVLAPKKIKLNTIEFQQDQCFYYRVDSDFFLMIITGPMKDGKFPVISLQREEMITVLPFYKATGPAIYIKIPIFANRIDCLIEFPTGQTDYTRKLWRDESVKLPGSLGMIDLLVKHGLRTKHYFDLASKFKALSNAYVRLSFESKKEEKSAFQPYSSKEKRDTKTESEKVEEDSLSESREAQSADAEMAFKKFDL